MKKLLPVAVAATTAIVAGCATNTVNNHVAAKTPVHQGEMGFPEFVQPTIKGAPTLSDPMLVMGSTKPVITTKHGLASPALWDWNNDGKRDLLIGEFETADADAGDQGSNIRVYLNTGTDSNPLFSDKWEYALDTQGNPLITKQW